MCINQTQQILIETLLNKFNFWFSYFAESFYSSVISPSESASLFCNTTNDDKDNLKLDTKISKKINNLNR